MENGGHNDFGNMGVAGIINTGLSTFDYAGNFNGGTWTGPGGTRADNSSWLMRLDSAGLHLTLPIFVDHLVMNGSAPTCAFTSGGGTTPACTVTTGSANGAGTIIATTGTGSPGGTGTITLTFASAMGTHYGNCLYMASDNGAGTWAALPVMKDKTPSTTTDLFTWTNGTVPTTLTTSTAYQINYHCEAQ